MTEPANDADMGAERAASRQGDSGRYDRGLGDGRVDGSFSSSDSQRSVAVGVELGEFGFDIHSGDFARSASASSVLVFARDSRAGTAWSNSEMTSSSRSTADWETTVNRIG